MRPFIPDMPREDRDAHHRSVERVVNVVQRHTRPYKALATLLGLTTLALGAVVVVDHWKSPERGCPPVSLPASQPQP